MNAINPIAGAQQICLARAGRAAAHGYPAHGASWRKNNRRPGVAGWVLGVADQHTGREVVGRMGHAHLEASACAIVDRPMD
jgi:hypothetical protein